MTDDTTRTQMPRSRLFLLGRVELVRGDDAVSTTLRFLPERRFRVATYLARRGDWVKRDELAALFWPERSQEAARSNLRKLLLEVRALELPGFDSDRDGVRWRVANDVADLNAALEKGDVDAANVLYRGAAMPGLEGGDSAPFNDWLALERQRLHGAWRDAVVAALPHRTPRDTLRLAGRLLDEDAYDEDAMVAVLTAHAALGDTIGAQRALARYAEALMEALGVEPSARVRAATASAAQTFIVATPSASPASATAPSAASDFIGRDREMEELATLLTNPDCRVLTVTGPGGVGKSRLAKEALRRLAPRYRAGVAWVALDDLAEAGQVAPRVAGELGVALSPKRDAIETLAAHLRPLQMLIVLDNCEHLPIAALLDRLAADAPHLQVLCTSRARIGVPREWLLPLGGLALTPGNETRELGTDDASRLFVTHARASHPRFDADAEAVHIAALVRAVGGLPLAILLAASWVRLLPMAELVREVTHSLDVLEGSDDGEERPEHRSMRATFEQSWRLLVPAEQRALAELSVMVGAFSRVAAKDVANAPLPLLAALVDKSLVQVEAHGRFALHPLIQQFAAEKLALEAGRTDAARDRHAESFGRFMSAFSNFNNLDQMAAVRAIAIELSNVLAAWNWAIARPALDVLYRCMSGLSNYFQARGPISDGVQLFTRAHATLDVHRAALTGPARDALWGLPLELAALNYWAADYSSVEACARKALEAARSLENAFGIRTSLNTLALTLMRRGLPEAAAPLLEEALASATAERVQWEIPAYAGNLVAIKRELGGDAEALALAREALTGHRANGNRIGAMSMTNEIGQIYHGMGQVAEAIAWYEQGLEMATAADAVLRRIQLLTHLASACLEAGDLQRAREGAGEALQVTLASGLLAHEPTSRRTVAAIDLASGDVAGARAHLLASIGAVRRIGTERVADHLLRDCALFFEHTGALDVAQQCLACAETHHASRATLIGRFRAQRERLLAGLSASPLSLKDGLDLAARSLRAP